MTTALLFPASATPDARRLVAARALRGFADGLVSVLLASHLAALGLSAVQVGAVVTATLLGSAALTLAVGLGGRRIPERSVLLAASLLMFATGLAFAGVSTFLLLLLVAFVGTLNPSGGDVSVFLPTEQALLAANVGAADRTALLARYNLGGTLLGALGALAIGVPLLVAPSGAPQPRAFLLYGAVAIAIGALYLGLRGGRTARAAEAGGGRLVEARSAVLRLTALFSLDSFGGGFVVDSLVALWLFRRFELSLEAAGAVFFAARLLSAFSQLVSPWLAARIGLVRTMVYTHLPANLFLIAAAFMPTAGSAIAMLLARMALSQMDVPARQSYVIAVTPPAERAAAVSLTNVPRSLASALSPMAAGALLEYSDFGWPLVIGGALKIVYDLLLLAQFRSVVPEEER
jgi:MFS family permease